MSQVDPNLSEEDLPGTQLVPSPQPPESALIDSREFENAYGEPLSRTLDLGTWLPGEDLGALYDRQRQEIEEAIRQENRLQEAIRKQVFPKLRTRDGAPRGAGVYQATPEDIERVHTGILFNGQVDACDGKCVSFDTLPLTIIQIGVCLVSYAGNQGSWVQRLYRRDLRISGRDPVDEALNLLDRRRQRDGVEGEGRRDALSSLAQRGIMAFAERAVLLHNSTAQWRLGHGNPAPYELLTGSGLRDLLERSLDLLDQLILKHQRFVFIPSRTTERFVLTIGNALQPLQYAVVDTMEAQLRAIIERGHYRGEWASLLRRVRDFAAEAGTRIVIGTYRTSALSPPRVFYAHEDHAHDAALIAMADSSLQEHRGFPMLIDLANTICDSVFGTDSFVASVQATYADVGEPYRYLSERQTRR